MGCLLTSKTLSVERIRIILHFVETVLIRVGSDETDLLLWDILWDTVKDAGSRLHPRLFEAGSLWMSDEGSGTTRNLNPAWSPRPGLRAENYTREINLGDQICSLSV